MDSPKTTCFCGRKTTQSHEFLFCSIECARQDSLRSLANNNSYYRITVRDAYAQAGAPVPLSRRALMNPTPRAIPYTPPPPQDFKTLKRIAPWIEPPNCDGGLAGKATGEQSRRENVTNGPSRSHYAAPVPGHVRPPHSDSSSVDHKKSPVAAFLKFGRSRKGKEVENPQVFGHPIVNTTTVPLVRNDPRRMGRTLRESFDPLRLFDQDFLISNRNGLSPVLHLYGPITATLLSFHICIQVSRLSLSTQCVTRSFLSAFHNWRLHRLPLGITVTIQSFP